ncbi:MAG: ribonuclease P [archaeon]|nr:ribonuclease P [archaeon]
MKISKAKLKEHTLERITTLFQEAKTNPKLANRYVEIARRIGMKANQPIPKDLKKKFCKHCNTYFQNSNYRVRTKNGYIVYTCFTCKKYSKYKI